METPFIDLERSVAEAREWMLGAVDALDQITANGYSNPEVRRLMQRLETLSREFKDLIPDSLQQRIQYEWELFSTPAEGEA